MGELTTLSWRATIRVDHPLGGLEGRYWIAAERAGVEGQRDEDGDCEGYGKYPATHVCDAPRAPAAENNNHHYRPEEVELLFNGQAP